jgi:Vitamin K-dependent gamma-carboxylase
MKRPAAAWERFWFEPEETSTLALVRIAFGTLVLAWTLTLTFDAYDFFSGSGLLPSPDFEGEVPGTWGVLELFEGRLAVALVLAVLALASVALIVGQWTRLAAVVVFVGIVSLERRNPFVFNSGDGLLKVIAFYMMLAPSGASFSLDRWRRERSAFWEFPRRAPWALRLMQVQLSVVYLSSVWTKLGGTTWNDGTALSYALRLEDIARFELPVSIATSELLVNLLTYGILGAEVAIGVLVWNRALRPYVLTLGVVMHLGIDIALRVGFFSFAVLVLYLAFLPPRQTSAAMLWLRDHIRSRSLRSGDRLDPGRGMRGSDASRDRVLRSPGIRGQLDR